MKHVCQCAEHKFDRSWFDQLPEVIRTVAVNAGENSKPYVCIIGRSKTEAPETWRAFAHIEHAWHYSLTRRFNLHPVIDAMLAYKPDNFAQLCLEWPHIAETDVEKLAYTRDDAKGHADIQTLTSIGKYVARHWPLVPDHIRRDVCSLYGADRMYFVEPNVEAFADAVDNGPKSCMQNGWNGRSAWQVHPYTVYDPALGWGMAVRMSGGQIDARALTHTDGDNKRFVRAYSRKESNGYSQGDTALTAWLESQDFEDVGSFAGARIRKVTLGYNPVLPYIDGGDQHVRSCGDDTFEICDSSEGEYECCNTNGTGDESEDDSIGSCEDCGDRIGEDDSYSMVGYHEDTMVCEHCCNRRYTFVYGQNSRGHTAQYYVHDRNAVTVNDEQYDEDNLPDHICQLEDGDYFNSETDDYCTIDDEYYLCDDNRVVCCDDGEHRLKDDCVQCADNEYRLRDDCWQCEGSEEWYSDDEEGVELDGETYHPDYLATLVASRVVAPLFVELV